MAVTYCTAAEVRASTNDASLSALTDPQINARIEEAEIYIDSHAGFWQRYDDQTPQVRLFPRIQDVNPAGTTFIPSAIKYATIAQVEFIFVNAPDRDHGIDEETEPTNDVMSPRAKKLMRGFVKRTGRVVLPETIVPELV